MAGCVLLLPGIWSVLMGLIPLFENSCTRIERYGVMFQFSNGFRGELKSLYSCLFDPDNTDCYSWTISKDGYFIFGGAFPGENARARFENQKQCLRDLGFRFGEVLKTESCLVLRPARPNEFCTGRNNAFLVGEAAGFVSPSSLEGISSAINSAYILSQVLNSRVKDPCTAYYRKTFGLRLKLTLKILKCPFMYFPPLRKLIMAAGVNSIEVIQNPQER